MTSAVPEARPRLDGVAVRSATMRDNRDLLALAASCSMRGAITMRMQREPDFFALSRLEGEISNVDVVESEYGLAGCIASSERTVYLNGAVSRTGYVGDLKVHPDYRNASVADALCNHAGARMDRLSPGAPTLISVLAGNRAMERRLPGPRGVPSFEWLATITTHSIPVLWKRSHRRSVGMQIETARWSDLDAMAVLWERVARERQFAAVMSVESLASWIRSAPGLDISSYLIARSRRGEMLGFVGLWDQRPLKQLYVERYSRKMSVVVSAMNVLGPAVGGARMAEPGEQMDCRTVVHTCVPARSPDVLNAILRSAHNSLRHTGCAFFNIGLDATDPLISAVDGFSAQPTMVNAYVGTRGETARDIENLRRRPLHYEISLV